MNLDDLYLRNKALVDWGEKNWRDFPWRQTQDPYAVLVAELMLHRTQVKQVVPIYERFMNCWPTLHLASVAQKEELQSVLHPLGLEWRIKAFIVMIEALAQDQDAAIPEDRELLLSLPGVSDYVASAVRRFAFGHNDTLMDVNTVRIAGRTSGMLIKDSSRRNLKFRAVVAGFDEGIQDPRAVGFALLDLAHLTCLKKDPKCGDCPIQPWCQFGGFVPSFWDTSLFIPVE